MKRTNTTFPSRIEKLDENTYVYRWDICEYDTIPAVIVEDVELYPAQTMWSYSEVEVYTPITANKITEAVITEMYGANIESKYVNDYNGVILGVLDQSYAQNYIKFLEARKLIKETIDAVCTQHGIPKK